ncbi:hypothetical protein F2P81_020021 [Scophthalmus maximus]|uniref:Uncharacterized protein n=1 Tax=Scophthalmus maximus TaxID=52904 RepID=A0A6A4S6V3_SCOMX|nr:hypothetical protein F2P81_020021 [Scophthalmus maximus]
MHQQQEKDFQTFITVLTYKTYGISHCRVFLVCKDEIMCQCYSLFYLVIQTSRLHVKTGSGFIKHNNFDISFQCSGSGILARQRNLPLILRQTVNVQMAVKHIIVFMPNVPEEASNSEYAMRAVGVIDEEQL